MSAITLQACRVRTLATNNCDSSSTEQHHHLRLGCWRIAFLIPKATTTTMAKWGPSSFCRAQLLLFWFYIHNRYILSPIHSHRHWLVRSRENTAPEDNSSIHGNYSYYYYNDSYCHVQRGDEGDEVGYTVCSLFHSDLVEYFGLPTEHAMTCLGLCFFCRPTAIVSVPVFLPSPRIRLRNLGTTLRIAHHTWLGLWHDMQVHNWGMEHTEIVIYGTHTPPTDGEINKDRTSRIQLGFSYTTTFQLCTWMGLEKRMTALLTGFGVYARCCIQ